MRVLMLGWEFPPFFAGGAGIVCDALARALNDLDVEVTFVMPEGPEKDIEKLNSKNKLLKVLKANTFKEEDEVVKIVKIKTLLSAYTTWDEYSEKYEKLSKKDKTLGLYGSNLMYEVERFSNNIKHIALSEDFDVIHAHDWTTFLAGIAVKELTGKPLVIHVHITEFDKSGGTYANPYIYRVEKEGMLRADKIIAVSHKIKDRCIHNYGIDPSKIEVVHNATSPMSDKILKTKRDDEKIVLFAGRITLQKGPEYFVEAAKLVNSINPHVRFVVAGSGDKLESMKAKVNEAGLNNNFEFLGFFTRDQAEEIFSNADVFVMPSISEPFGVVPYEAQIKKTPTIISKQSGISEILDHTLKVDFWDVKDIANKILALIYYKDLHLEIQEKGYYEAKNTTWELPASKCLNIYRSMVELK
ncbi:MAG: glycosyltransferase family 4 protein [Candidatus Woesearchaeota archaeon]